MRTVRRSARTKTFLQLRLRTRRRSAGTNYISQLHARTTKILSARTKDVSSDSPANQKTIGKDYIHLSGCTREPKTNGEVQARLWLHLRTNRRSAWARYVSSPFARTIRRSARTNTSLRLHLRAERRSAMTKYISFPFPRETLMIGKDNSATCPGRLRRSTWP